MTGPETTDWGPDFPFDFDIDESAYEGTVKRLRIQPKLDRCAEIHYTSGGFARALFVYTPTLDRCSGRGSNSSIHGVVSRPPLQGGGNSAARQVIDISEQLSS